LAPPDTVRKLGIRPRIRVGSRRSSGIGLPFASTGTWEAAFGVLPCPVAVGASVAGGWAKAAAPSVSGAAEVEMAGRSDPAAAAAEANRVCDGASGRTGREDCWAHAAEAARRSARCESRRRARVRSKGRLTREFLWVRRFFGVEVAGFSTWFALGEQAGVAMSYSASAAFEIRLTALHQSGVYSQSLPSGQAVDR